MRGHIPLTHSLQHAHKYTPSEHGSQCPPQRRVAAKPLHVSQLRGPLAYLNCNPRSAIPISANDRGGCTHAPKHQFVTAAAMYGGATVNSSCDGPCCCGCLAGRARGLQAARRCWCGHAAGAARRAAHAASRRRGGSRAVSLQTLTPARVRQARLWSSIREAHHVCCARAHAKRGNGNPSQGSVSPHRPGVIKWTVFPPSWVSQGGDSQTVQCRQSQAGAAHVEQSHRSHPGPIGPREIAHRSLTPPPNRHGGRLCDGEARLRVAGGSLAPVGGLTAKHKL